MTATQPVQGEAVCDCGANADNRWPHHDECSIYTQPPAPAVVDGKCRHMRTMDQICDPCARYPTPAVQIAAPGDVGVASRLLAQWAQQADECEAMANRLGKDGSMHMELLRDAAQYRQTIYQVGLIVEEHSAALRSQGQADAVVDDAAAAFREIIHRAGCNSFNMGADVATIAGQALAALAQQANKEPGDASR